MPAGGPEALAAADEDGESACAKLPGCGFCAPIRGRRSSGGAVCSGSEVIYSVRGGHGKPAVPGPRTAKPGLAVALLMDIDTATRLIALKAKVLQRDHRDMGSARRKPRQRDEDVFFPDLRRVAYRTRL